MGPKLGEHNWRKMSSPGGEAVGPGREMKGLTLDGSKDTIHTLFTQAKAVGANAGVSGSTLGGMLRLLWSRRGQVELKSSSCSTNQTVRPHPPGEGASFLISPPKGVVVPLTIPPILIPPPHTHSAPFPSVLLCQLPRWV